MAETIPGAQAKADSAKAGAIAASAPLTHVSDTANPHAVTKAQVGLGNVDNTSDVNKPVSTAQASAIAANNNPFGFNFTIDPVTMRSGDSMAGPAGGAIYMRVRDAATITKIGLQCTVTSAGTISVAVYRNGGSGRAAAPSTQVATSGSIAVPGVGYTEIPLGASVNVAAGDWFGISFSDATAKFVSLLVQGGGSTLGAGRQAITSTGAHPLPATPSSLQATIGWNFCLIGVP